jgi:hypothetical protein
MYLPLSIFIAALDIVGEAVLTRLKIYHLLRRPKVVNDLVER